MAQLFVLLFALYSSVFSIHFIDKVFQMNTEDLKLKNE